MIGRSAVHASTLWITALGLLGAHLTKKVAEFNTALIKKIYIIIAGKYIYWHFIILTF